MIDTYSNDFKTGTVQAAIRERAEHRCEHCGIEFYPHTNIAIEATNQHGHPIIGTVHHINGRKQDNRWENLLYCCQTCHLAIQGRWKPGQMLPIDWCPVPLWIVIRELDYIEPPRQLSLWSG